MNPPLSLKMDNFKRIQVASLVIGNKTYPIFKGVNTIGRNKAAVINIKHLNVSQNQAIIIVVDETQHYISDLNSSNGTFLLKTKMIPCKLYELTNNAEITFGDVNGIYSKISYSDRTINLQEAELSQMTQNMTQNFYASDTQLIPNHDKTDLEVSRAEQTNKSFNIHEEPTQVVYNPPVLPKSRNINGEQATHVDIHDAPTQVCILTKMTHNQSVDLNIHEAPTQVIIFNEHNKEGSESKSSNSNTQVMTIEEREDISKRISDFNNQITISEEHDTTTKLNEDNVAIKESRNINDNIPLPTIHNSQEPSTSKSKNEKEYDESFINTKLNKTDVYVEETIIENTNSNDSFDFLTLVDVQNENVVLEAKCSDSSQSSTISDIQKPRRLAVKLPDTQLEDSETDIETTQDNFKTASLPIPNTPIDVSTDNEYTQDVGFRKKPLKPIIEESDSDTDIDATQENIEKPQQKSNSVSKTNMDNTPEKVVSHLPKSNKADSETNKKNTPEEVVINLPKTNKTDSDSETDCEELSDKQSVKVIDSKTTNDISDFDTDIEANLNDKGDFNDSDCIPATQDAFAEALGYKPIKSSQMNNNQSSEEESFKLGLTELMTFTDDDKDENLEKKEQSSEKLNVATIEKNDKDVEDEIKESNEADEAAKKFTFKKNPSNSEASLAAFLSMNKIEDTNIAPNSISEDSDNNSDVLVKDIVVKLTQDDIFLQPTQVINVNKPEHVFAKPFNKDDVFLQPTQLIASSQSRNINTQDDDVYLAPTQIIFEKSTTETTDDIPMTQEDLYGQATQVLEENSSSVTKRQEEPLDMYMLPTQQITGDSNADVTETETQLEMQTFNENLELEITVQTDRPINPIIQEFSNENKKIENNGSTIETVINVKDTTSKSTNDILNTTTNDSCIETLSQIEAFIKKPLPPRKSSRKLKPIENLNKTMKESKDNAETMSQIEAFINKPMPSTERKSLVKKSIKQEDETETLSQISAFVNKPFPKSDDTKSTTSSKAINENSIVNETITSEPSSSRRISKRPSSRNSVTEEINESKKLKIIEDTITDTEEETEKKDTSREIRSDIDQSFALLESKSSKVRRKPNNDPVLEEIKVSVTSHRRSMSIAENQKKKEDLEKLMSTKLRGSTNVTSITPRLRRPSKSIPNSAVFEHMESDHQIHRENFSIIDQAYSKNTRKSKIPSTSNDDPQATNSIEIKEKNEPLPRPSRGRKPKLPSTNNKNETESTKNNKDNKNIANKTESELDNNDKSTRSKKSRTLTVNINKNTNKEVIDSTNKKKNEETTNVENKNTVSESSEDEFKKNVSKTSKAVKRHITDSSIDTSGSSTPVKHSRTDRKSKAVISDDSNTNSRDSSASNDITTPKKSKNAPNIEALTSSGERSKRKLKPKVVFTMLDNPKLESYIKHLGGSIVDSVDAATVLMTQNVKRSQKLLTAVAQGKPICAPNWVEDSKKNNGFLDPWDYILIDKQAEAKWKFSLKESLLRADNKKLLTDYSFQLIVSNAAEVLKGAIEASGGKCVAKVPNKNHLENFIIVASPDQKTKYAKIKKQYPDIVIVEPEAIFDGVLRQELRLSQHILT